MLKKNLEKVALSYLPCVCIFSKKAITPPKKISFENSFFGVMRGHVRSDLKIIFNFFEKVKRCRPNGITSFEMKLGIIYLRNKISLLMRRNEFESW